MVPWKKYIKLSAYDEQYNVSKPWFSPIVHFSAKRPIFYYYGVKLYLRRDLDNKTLLRMRIDMRDNLKKLCM